MANKTLMHTDWRFHLGEAPGADFMGYDDSSWRTVCLPHDWSVEAPFDRSNASGTGYLPGGVAWYRKNFELPEDVVSKTVRVTFGGIYKHARVYINSYYLGMQAYGYTTFTMDLTPFVRPGINTLAVRVEHNDVADSRWFTGSGIYRDVQLEICDKCCFKPDGIVFCTEQADENRALLSVQWEAAPNDEVRFTLKDKENAVVASAEGKGENGKLNLELASPALWSVENPVLYTLEASTILAGDIRDTVLIPVGIRVARFDPDKGFFLNGKSMKLKGVCVHHDAGALGAAVPKEVWERRLRVLKDLGCNAIRTAHNPPDTHLLDLCDAMGFVVMDEAFDEWEGCKNKWWQGHNVYPPKHFGYAEDFPQWHRSDLTNMIKRDINHPSIILWSIGNEVDYPNDPYVTPLFNEVMGNNDSGKPQQERIYDDRKPDASRLVTVAAELVDIVHKLDPSRPVLSALSFPELSTRTGLSETLDVLGYNYRENFYDEDHERFPDKVIFGSENGQDPKAWDAVTDREFISGQFLWTGVDFLGECKGWPIRISQAGCLDLCGFEKPVAAMRKAMWTTEPYVRMAAGKDANCYQQRFVWSAFMGEMQTISCYTNQETVTLFLNGENLGTRKVGRENGYQATFTVPFTPGVLEAVAGTASDRLITPEVAEDLEILPDKDRLIANSHDVMQIEIRLVDKNGNIATDDDRRLYVQVLGDAKILGMENGKPDDLTPYSEPFRSTWQGRMLVYLRSGSHPGPVTLAVSDRGRLYRTLDIAVLPNR